MISFAKSEDFSSIICILTGYVYNDNVGKGATCICSKYVERGPQQTLRSRGMISLEVIFLCGFSLMGLDRCIECWVLDLYYYFTTIMWRDSYSCWESLIVFVWFDFLFISPYVYMLPISTSSTKFVHISLSQSSLQACLISFKYVCDEACLQTLGNFLCYKTVVTMHFRV